MTMKLLGTYIDAAILVQQNEPLLIEKVKLPNFLDVGQVLVKVNLSGICGSQVGEILGTKGPDKFLPHLLGHEGCATVLEIGPGVSHVKPGDLVVLHWRKGLGIQSKPPIYFWNNNKINAGWVTTFNSHAIVSENRCTKIPSDTDTELAALFGCAVTTGFGVVENNACLKIGESVVVFGAGGIGLNVIQAASLRSANPIIAVDIIEERLNFSKKLGATHIVNSKDSNIEESIRSILGDRDLDVFIDNTGIPKFIELGYQLTSKEGRVILVGVPKIGSEINFYSLPLHFGKIITGSHGGECKPEKDINRYLRFINNSVSNMKNIITSRYSLDQINEAIDSIKDGSALGRVIINYE